MTIRFDNFEIDLSTREVRRNDVPLGIEPKVFDLLVFLINNANRVVSRDDMIGAVWDGRILSDANGFLLASKLCATRWATMEKPKNSCAQFMVAGSAL